MKESKIATQLVLPPEVAGLISAVDYTSGRMGRFFCFGCGYRSGHESGSPITSCPSCGKKAIMVEKNRRYSFPHDPEIKSIYKDCINWEQPGSLVLSHNAGEEQITASYAIKKESMSFRNLTSGMIDKLSKGDFGTYPKNLAASLMLYNSFPLKEDSDCSFGNYRWIRLYSFVESVIAENPSVSDEHLHDLFLQLGGTAQVIPSVPQSKPIDYLNRLGRLNPETQALAVETAMALYSSWPSIDILKRIEESVPSSIVNWVSSNIKVCPGVKFGDLESLSEYLVQQQISLSEEDSKKIIQFWKVHCRLTSYLPLNDFVGLLVQGKVNTSKEYYLYKNISNLDKRCSPGEIGKAFKNVYEKPVETLEFLADLH